MDIQLHYMIAGQGFPLVMLHGNGEDHTYFKRQMEPFSEQYQVIALDTRGHGRSPRGTAPFTLEQFAEDLKGFLDSLHSTGVAVNLDPANLIMVTGDDPVQAVHNLKDYIVHTHAKDGVRNYYRDPEEVYGLVEAEMLASPSFAELPLGQGGVDFGNYLKALDEIGYHGFLTIEREVGDDPEKDIRLAVDFLNGLMR